MLSIPLPFAVSLVLCLALIRMVRREEGGTDLFAVLIAAFAVQAALSGLNWSYGWAPARLIQPTVAAILPALSFVTFSRLRITGESKLANLWPHFLPSVLVAVLSLLWRAPLDLVLFAIYLGYGIALLSLARQGSGALVAARFGDERAAHKALILIGFLLIATAFIDASVSLDLIYGGGRLAGAIGTVASVVWLGIAGYAATVAEGSRPPELVGTPRTIEATTVDAAVDPVRDDATILRQLEKLMTEQHVYRDPDLTLERLARKMAIPSRQISSAVNRIQGRNVSQLVNEYRIEDAKRRLATGSESVTKVMLECGFGTKSNFNREFLRITGMAPREFRRSNRVQENETLAE